MSVLWLSLLLACVALSAAPVRAERPNWMPDPPPLPVTGRIVNVSSVAQLREAVTNARDGDTIMVADGTYQLDHFLQLTGRTGVTIRGESGDATKVELRGIGWDDTDRDDILRIQACTDITIAYLTFADCRAYGVKLEQTEHEGRRLRGIHIYACNFRDNGTRAIKGTGGGGGFVDGGSIRYCNFENTKIPPKTWLYDGDYITAIDCMRLKDWVIADNYFRNIRGAGGGARGAVFVWVGSENVVTERNVFVNCDNSVCYGNPSGSTENGAKPHNTGGIIRNNFIVGGVRTAIELCWAVGVKVYHNTVLTSDPETGRAINHLWRELRDIEIRNNIIRGRVWGDEGGITLSNNATRGIEDAWFRDAGSGDLHLTEAGRAALGMVDRLPGAAEDFDGAGRPASTRPGADE